VTRSESNSHAAPCPLIGLLLGNPAVLRGPVLARLIAAMKREQLKLEVE
jgi:hypothetical protein